MSIIGQKYKEYRAAGGTESYEDIYGNVLKARHEQPERYVGVTFEESLGYLLDAMTFIQARPLEVLKNIANADVKHTEVGMCYAMNRMALQTPKAAAETLRRALAGEFNDKNEQDLFEDFNIRKITNGGYFGG